MISHSIEQQYQLQAQCEETMQLPSSYVDADSVDNWRHKRILELTRPIWEAHPEATWMTVGDGRYGSDAAYLHSHNVQVIATSLTDERLRRANEMGFIREYRAENAESISLKDSSVDFILCKAAYHHFPRPTMALYEMLRVARTAVVLIEPLDEPRLLDGAKSLAKRLIRGDQEQQFEPSGNYLYRLSIKELAKTMTAMGGCNLSVLKFNDFFHGKYSKYRSNTVNRGMLATRAGILVQDLLSSIGLLGYGLAAIIVYKCVPDESLIRSLTNAGYKTQSLPKNPYI